MSRLIKMHAVEVNLCRRALLFLSKALLEQKRTEPDERIKTELQQQIDAQHRLSERLLRGD